MSKLIDKIYDDMNLQEIICRLPSDLAVSAIKRRINSTDKLADFFKAAEVEKETSKCDGVKRHVNELVRNNDIKKVLNDVGENYHPVLHGYLDDDNKRKFVQDGADELSIQFLFNLTDADDKDGIRRVLGRILKETSPSVAQVLSVLNKVSVDNFQSVLDAVIKDNRPIVRSCVLSVYNRENYDTISEHQKMIGLKAFAKIPSSKTGAKGIRAIDFKLFQNMKPLERLLALDRYLSYFPAYQKVKAFNPEPTKEDFDAILFAGCFEYYDLVESITKKYKAITQEGPTV